MKSYYKIIGHSLVMMILWIITASVAQQTMGVKFPTTEDNPLIGLGTMWLTSLSFVVVIDLYIQYTRLNGFWRIVSVFILLFGVQTFLSQIESIYFLGQVKLSIEMIYAILLGGFLQCLFYAGYISFFHPTTDQIKLKSMVVEVGWIFRVLFLIILAYPAIYFLAGYFIAWQSPALRTYYQGNAELASFWAMMRVNINSGLYVFQVFRAIIWVLIGSWYLKTCLLSRVKSAVLLGASFAVLMGVGLLIPNPFMPSEIRFFHAMELLSSNFIWGYLMAWNLFPYFMLK